MKYDAVVLNAGEEEYRLASALNESGDVLVNASDNTEFNFLLQMEPYNLSDQLPPYNSKAYVCTRSGPINANASFFGRGLNSRRDIVGSGTTVNDQFGQRILVRPIYYHAGIYEDLLPDWAISGHATSISENCRIVGFVTRKRMTPYPSRLPGVVTEACYWLRGKCVALPNPGLDEVVGCLATGQNEQDLIIGCAGRIAKKGIWTDLRAIKWEGGRVEYLAEPTGCTRSVCEDANNRGEIVGWIRRIDRSGDVVIRSVLWKPDSVVDLLSRDGVRSFGLDVNRTCKANGINDRGVIVGSATSVSGKMVASVLEDLVVFDLNTLTSVEGGYKLFYAFAINNSGEIACLGSCGGRLAVVLLTPR